MRKYLPHETHPLPPEESIVNNWLPFYKSWNLYDVWERWNQRLNSLLESCLSARNAHHLIPSFPPFSSSLTMPKACSRKLTLARAVFILPSFISGMTIRESFRISHVVSAHKHPSSVFICIHKAGAFLQSLRCLVEGGERSSWEFCCQDWRLQDWHLTARLVEM